MQLVDTQEDLAATTDDEVVIVEGPTPATAPSSTASNHARSPRPRSISPRLTRSHALKPNSKVNKSSASQPTSPVESRPEGATTNGASAASGTDDDTAGDGNDGNAGNREKIGATPNQENGIDAAASMDVDENEKPPPPSPSPSPPQLNGVTVTDDEGEVSNVIHVASSPEPSGSKPA